MKITLLHPSRGRSEKAKSTYDYWINNSSGKNVIEHIVSIDRNDPARMRYYSFPSSSIITCNENNSVVDATNAAAKLSTGDILIYLSDDFKCPKDWDELIIKIFEGIEFPLLVKADDCLQKFHVGVLTIPIMNRLLYNKLGYFWHPEYRSMFVDEDLYWTCRNNGWMVLAEELKFPHEHPCNGKAPNDETYKRSAANWNQGKALFAKRKQLNFPL